MGGTYPATRIKFNAPKGYLVDFFTADRNLRDITVGGADDWRVFLLVKGMSENTVRKHTQIARQFFTAAVRRKLFESNPFAGLKSTVQANPERFHFVTPDAAAKVLAACRDAEWRLIFALIGSTKAVAAKHYLQTTDEHFRKATQNPT